MRQKEQISTYLKNTFSDACSRDSVQHRWKNDSISPKSRVEPLAFNTEHHHANSTHCSLKISHGADKDNLFNTQEPFSLVIISSILVTLMCDLGWNFKEKLDAGHS